MRKKKRSATVAKSSLSRKSVSKKPKPSQPSVRAKPITPPFPIPSGPATTVKGIRYWSNPHYTRVVIDADKETMFAHRLLRKDPAIGKPPRLYVDLNNSRLADNFQKVISINDNLLSDARAGQYTPKLVRVVVDLKSFETYKLFSLRNPFRIVIDIRGTQKTPKKSQQLTASIPKDGAKLGTSALARQLALGVRRIVIDPGHGGKDYGAPGYLKGVHEKNLTLQIARRLRDKIKTELGCEVFLTRNSDKYLTLEERTAIANTLNADLFVSIHTNSHRDRRAFGIETYILNFATDNEAILVAARENATSAKNISDLQTILTDLMHHTKVDESSRLASHVQSTMHKNLKKNYSQIRDKGVKHAPFYVLLGAEMPAILIETAFISNSRECKRLVSRAYQTAMVDAISSGIKKYIHETNPTALLNNKPASGGKG
ncbi:MAG: N-acetylmuramoyl-L-alanine amidase [Deltaproteobacteria bacterium]|nr:N-acetylmuramoyl-L-alanine amidase [Deltaproteobacteria bacterium]